MTWPAGEVLVIGGKKLNPYMRAAALEEGRPLPRVEMVRVLNERGVHVAGQDQVVNVGTALWRAKDEFVQLKPYGYWPRDVPYAPAGHDPATSESHGGDGGGDGGDDSDVSDEHAPTGNGTSSFAWGTP